MGWRHYGNPPPVVTGIAMPAPAAIVNARWTWAPPIVGVMLTPGVGEQHLDALRAASRPSAPAIPRSTPSRAAGVAGTGRASGSMCLLPDGEPFARPLAPQSHHMTAGRGGQKA